MFTKVLRSLGMRGRVLTLDAPISGDVIPLSEVNDQTFATGLLGQGVAIQPTGTRVIAPADAKVEAIFPTGHAVALNTVDGLDVLIHVGLDTVQLEGKHFTVHAQVGDIVHKGGAMKIRSATFFMSRGAERKWQRTVFSLSAMLAE